MRVRVFARALAASCVSILAFACASAPPRAEVPRPLSPSEEADLIAAARRHPIATTYERPRTAAQLPVAPPKIPAEPAAPPATPVEAPASRDQVVLIGNEPAPPPAASYTWPDTSDPTYYASEPRVWVDGAWVARPSWRGYVATPWVGVGVGRPWGVGLGVSVGRPWGWGYNDYGYGWGYRPRTWVAPPPVYRAPPVYVAPRPRYHPPARSWGYPSGSRRQVYVAPRAPAPVYRAPPASARPRSPAPVYRAPAATPRSSGSSSGGGRRTVHVR